MSINPEYRTLEMIIGRPALSILHGASSYRQYSSIGRGYRGTFAGEGFDSIWTDMSEIVRPTRDGIHGREYINTM